MDNYRYELKYTCPNIDYPTILAWSRCHPAAFRQAYPPRQVNSAYFDTYTWSNFNDTLAGLLSRGKLRLRWYDTEVNNIQSILEYKVKHGMFGYKISHPCKARFNLDKMSWKDILDTLDAEATGSLRPVVNENCMPTVICSYQRDYFISGSGKVRLTIDRNLCAYDQTLSSKPNTINTLLGIDNLVVEIKGPATEHQEIRHIAQHIPLRLSANSKYTQAVFGTTNQL